MKKENLDSSWLGKGSKLKTLQNLCIYAAAIAASFAVAFLNLHIGLFYNACIWSGTD